MKAKHKFRAVPTVKDNIKFPSKKEAEYYEGLKKNKDVIGFFRQIPLDLPGGIRYVMDFLVFYKDGTCKGIETKGFQTKEWKLKKRLVDKYYPWLILDVV